MYNQLTMSRVREIGPVLTRLFSELVDGANDPNGAFILNSGDVGLLRSLDKISAADASRSVDAGATIAAHAQHVRYGLSLMNRWANEGGNPFADAKWDEAWTVSTGGRRRVDGDPKRPASRDRTPGSRHSGHRVTSPRSSSAG